MINKKFVSLKKKFNNIKTKHGKFIITILFFSYFIFNYIFGNSAPFSMFLIASFYEINDSFIVMFFYFLTQFIILKQFIVMLINDIETEINSLNDNILILIKKKTLKTLLKKTNTYW
jgi:hypothetical protein